MSGIIMGLIMGLLGGPALAMAVNSSKSVEKFEQRKTDFANGKGKNPETDPIGPHKSFKHNALIFGLVFGVIGFLVGSMAG